MTISAQPTPDAALARAILAAALGADAIAIERFPTGNQHYVYDCRLAGGGQAVVRIADAHNRAHMVAAAQCSDLLRPLGVPLPAILARGLAAECAYLVLARLPGTDLGHAIGDLSRAQRAGVAADVARAQDIASSLPSRGRYGFAARPEEAPHSSWSAVLHASLDRSRRRIAQAALMDMACVERVRAVVRAREAALDAQPATCFLHDTTTKNVIVHAGRLSGIVDVDDFCYGDPLFVPALTLMSLMNTRGPIDYIVAWLAAARAPADWRLALYAAIFCVDFMAEHGQVFNGNIVPSRPEDRARLEAILARLLAAAGSDDASPLTSLAMD
jgi:hypothetical protein